MFRQTWFVSVPSDVRTYSRPVSGSNAAPPQSAPPLVVGRISVPRRLGGVNSGPSRNCCISATASAWISGVRSFASSRNRPVR